ncbi:MAG: putative bifunctional diguanylate cyclase/phosphodiesterase [Beijerinckiaceae bacterium]
MTLAAFLLYWIIVAAWLAVVSTAGLAFVRNPRTFGAVRLLLLVVMIGAFRNLFENFYFGLYFGAQHGFLFAEIGTLLSNPSILIVPKLMDLADACLVAGVLLLRWLPIAAKERYAADKELRQKSAELVQEIEERRRLFETSLDLILVTDGWGNFTRVSPSALATLGYRPDEMVGRNGAAFIYPPDLDPTRDEMRLARRGQHIRNFETRYVHKNGHLVELAWSGVWSEPEKRHFFFGRDITESNAAKAKLRYLALFDQLTGLPNRSSLEIDLADLMKKSSQGRGSEISIVLFELDGFKEVNNTLGYSVGDRVLQEIANRVVAVVDRSRRFYRVDGNKFALALPDCSDPLAASDVARSILKQFDSSFQIAGYQVFVGANAGIAVAPQDGSRVDDLLSNADLALHDAKTAGGHVVRPYLPLLRERAWERQQLGNELRRAWANQEFVLYFQPQLRVRDEAIVGAEALVRWQHPQRGLLSPGSFIESLAESAIVLDVGRWILTKACQTAAVWRANGNSSIRIGVNVFPAQFRHATLLSDVQAALAESGLPPDALDLEITENIALAYDETLLKLLTELRSTGVGLAFDDFGTGFASLSYLARFPFTSIKIDRSFVQNISGGSGAGDTAIVRSIIAMAHNLGLTVTAEGVETSAQMGFLRARRCDEVQGFLFAKPLPADEFEAMMISGWRQPHAQQKAVE